MKGFLLGVAVVIGAGAAALLIAGLWLAGLYGLAELAGLIASGWSTGMRIVIGASVGFAYALASIVAGALFIAWVEERL